MFLRALSLAKVPVLIAIFVTPIRFFLELAGERVGVELYNFFIFYFIGLLRYRFPVPHDSKRH